MSRVNARRLFGMNNTLRVSSSSSSASRAARLPFPEPSRRTRASARVSSDWKVTDAGLLGCGSPAYPAGWPARRTGRKGVGKEDLPRKEAGGEAAVRREPPRARAPHGLGPVDLSITVRRVRGWRKHSTWLSLDPAPADCRRFARSRTGFVHLQERYISRNWEFVSRRLTHRWRHDRPRRIARSHFRNYHACTRL